MSRMTLVVLVFTILFFSCSQKLRISDPHIRHTNKNIQAQVIRDLERNSSTSNERIIHFFSTNNSIFSTYNYEFTNFQISFKKVRVSSQSPEDLYLEILLESPWWKETTRINTIFDKSGKTKLDPLVFVGWNKCLDSKFEFMDLTGDKIDEVILKFDGSGNQSSDLHVKIFNVNTKGFQCIFDEGLIKGYGSFPYSYNNKFEIDKNSTPFSIKFRIQASLEWDPYYVKSQKEYQSKLKKILGASNYSFTNDYVFFYNGTSFESDKPLWDYEKPFRLDRELW